MGSDLDLAEARSFQNAAHAVGVSERERAGRVRIVSGLRRQMSGRGPERQDVERVLLQRSPADEGESPIRPEAATNVDERRSGVSEEHHPKPREGGVERGRFEWEHLGICLTNRTRSHPLAARCANASTAADRSIPTTVPSGATARARSSAVSPPPQPMSRTLSPGCGASAAKARRPSGASCSSNGSRTSAHAPTRTSSWVSAGRGLIWSMLRSLPDGLGMSRSPCKPPLYVLNVGCWAGPR